MAGQRDLPRRILVVGGGFIGSAIARNALRRGLGVRLLTRSLASSLESVTQAGADVVVADAADVRAMASAIQDVDHVFYTVGDLRAGIADSGPGGDMSRAIPPLLSTLEACRQHPSVQLTFLSSGGTVYGEARKLPIAEDHPTEPLVAYGIMKLACEKYVGLYARLHGVDARIARCANAFGEGQPGDRPQGVVAAFLHRLARSQPVTVFGDGAVVRDFIHVNDLANSLLALHAAPAEPRIVNIGTGVGTSLSDLLRLIKQVTGRSLQVTWEPSRAFDVSANVLDVSTLRRLIEFNPLSLEQGVRLTWQESLDGVKAETGAGIFEPL